MQKANIRPLPDNKCGEGEGREKPHRSLKTLKKTHNPQFYLVLAKQEMSSPLNKLKQKHHIKFILEYKLSFQANEKHEPFLPCILTTVIHTLHKL